MQVTCNLFMYLPSQCLCEFHLPLIDEEVENSGISLTLNSPSSLNCLKIGIGEGYKIWNSLSGIRKILRAKLAFSVMS